MPEFHCTNQVEFENNSNIEKYAGIDGGTCDLKYTIGLWVNDKGIENLTITIPDQVLFITGTYYDEATGEEAEVMKEFLLKGSEVTVLREGANLIMNGSLYARKLTVDNWGFELKL